MNLTIRNVKSLVSKRKIVRGIDPLEVQPNRLNKVCDISMDEIQSSILRNKELEWHRGWKSLRVLNEKKARLEFKPIPRFENLLAKMIENLQHTHPIKIDFTRNVGAEYIYYTSEKDSRYHHDWVHVPHPFRFSNNKFYYKTFIHELGHAACSRNRLCLKFGHRDEEEIAVESSAVIISFLLGINVWNDCISYMQNRSYGLSEGKNPAKLCIRTKKQWMCVRNKTRRIVQYLLTGKKK